MIDVKIDVCRFLAMLKIVGFFPTVKVATAWSNESKDKEPPCMQCW